MIFGVEPVIGPERNDVRAQPPRIAYQGAGLDADRLGRVAGGDRHGGFRRRLYDDNRLPAQGRVLLLLARREKGLRSRNSHCTAFSVFDVFIICSIN